MVWVWSPSLPLWRTRDSSPQCRAEGQNQWLIVFCEAWRQLYDQWTAPILQFYSQPLKTAYYKYTLSPVLQIMNQITEVDAQEREFIKQKAKATFVVLQNCGIGDEGMRWLGQYVHGNTHNLWLKSNKIGPKGMRHLIGKNWTNVVLISLHDNHLGNLGCKMLTRVDFNSVRSIDLSKNEVGSQGVLHISKACWPNLEYLSLMGNRIRSDSMPALARGNWRFLIQLYLLGNSIDKSEIISIMTIIFPLKFFNREPLLNDNAMHRWLSNKIRQ